VKKNLDNMARHEYRYGVINIKKNKIKAEVGDVVRITHNHFLTHCFECGQLVRVVEAKGYFSEDWFLEIVHQLDSQIAERGVVVEALDDSTAFAFVLHEEYEMVSA
jgi:hypothetical protein